MLTKHGVDAANVVRTSRCAPMTLTNDGLLRTSLSPKPHITSIEQDDVRENAPSLSHQAIQTEERAMCLYISGEKEKLEPLNH